MFNTIFAQTRGEIDDFINNPIQVVEGYTFDTYKTIKRCHLYRNSQFEDGSKYNGYEKIFYNVVNNPCDTETRYYNFDTKDIRLISGDFKSDLASFLLTKENKYWLKKSKFANLLNDIAEELPVYGSVIIKKAKKNAKICDLRYSFYDPTVNKITDSRFFTTEYNLTESKLKQLAKENGWDSNVAQSIIYQYRDCDAQDSYVDEQGINHIKSTKLIKVYERFGEVPKKWLEGDMTEPTPEDEYVRSLFVISGKTIKTNPETGEKSEQEGKILFKSKWFGDYPLQDFHRKKTKGRWLGISTVEELFPIQERVNELVNQKRISMEISSKHMFQTQDETILKSLLKDVESGVVLKAGPKGGIQPVVNEERNLAAFASEMTDWKENGRSITFAYDVAQDMPSSMPATNAVIQNRSSSGVYTFRRENIGNGLRDFFNDFVLEQLIKDLTPEHMFEFTGDMTELQKFDRLVVKNLTKQWAIDKMLNGELVSEQDIEMTKEDISRQLKDMGSSRWTKVKKDLYKNADLRYDFIITGEQEDVNLMSQNLFNVLQTLMKAPQVLDDPRMKLLIYKYAEMVGVSLEELELAEEKTQGGEQQQALGGGMQNLLPNPQQNEVQNMEQIVSQNDIQ